MSNNKRRTDYHAEQFQDVYDGLSERFGDDLPDQLDGEIAQGPKEQAESIVRREDELIWAYYRDPKTSLTQLEARDRAQTTDYPDGYNLSQSSISRKLSKLDDTMLTEPIKHLRMKEREEAEQLAGLIGPQELDGYKRNGFTDLLDAYRETLARFLVDREALKKFMDGETPTPAWAQERFPNLDPDIGRRYYLRTGMAETSVHAPTSEQASTETSRGSAD